MENNNNQKTELGALWSRNTKTNEKFLSGKINLKSLGFDKDVEVIIFKNRNKEEGSKHPDLKIYLSTPRPATANAAPSARTSAPTPVPAGSDDLI